MKRQVLFLKDSFVCVVFYVHTRLAYKYVSELPTCVHEKPRGR